MPRRSAWAISFKTARHSRQALSRRRTAPASPGATCARSCQPKITDTLAQAIPLLDRRLHGFALPDAVLTAPETRSSSPVRIIRGQNLQASLAGLYPCGEGAGYAGGIMSAAADGIRCAEALIARQQGAPAAN